MKLINQFLISITEEVLAKNLSAGQRRKLSIAISLIGIIFLDEP
jgi:ABC-type multidrug transport system ATPase subunit